jgi:hypothetical protein
MAMTCLRIMVVRFFVRVWVIRHQAQGIRVACDSFQHADHPRPVESTNSVSTSSSGRRFTTTFFATLQSLQPVSAATQHLNFSCQAGSDLGFRLRLLRFFLSTGTSAQLSQLA